MHGASLEMLLGSPERVSPLEGSDGRQPLMTDTSALMSGGICGSICGA